MQFEKELWHLRTYPLIIILIIGLFGNGFIFYIFFRPNFRTSTITKYIRILIVSDSIVLLVGSIPNIYNGFNGNMGLIDSSTTVCIMQRFIMFFSGDISVWTLTAITIDRLVAVVFPHQNLFWKSNKNTVFVLIIIFSLSLLKNFPIFFTLASINGTYCGARQLYEVYENNARPAISLILYYLIPTVTMTVCTILIIKEMRIVVSRIRGMSNLNNRMSVSNDYMKHHYSKSLTKMSIAINILFFVLITPSIIIWTIISYEPDFRNKDMTVLFFDITNIFVFSHHSLNFYLFFITGPRFRREVLLIFSEKYANITDSRDYSNKTNPPENIQHKETSFN